MVFHERYPSRPESVRLARHGVIDALTDAGFADAALCSRIGLAVSEATGNVVRHAYPPEVSGHIEVTVSQTDGEIVVTIADTGVGVETASQQPGMGMGLKLMRTLTTSLGIESRAAGTTVALHFASPN
jgi:anti-sigma regulatory factor (Ser/Thr protein kinase)